MRDSKKASILQTLMEPPVPEEHRTRKIPPIDPMTTMYRLPPLRPLEERLECIKDNARGLSFEDRVKRITAQVAGNKAMTDDHRQTLDWALDRKAKKDELLGQHQEDKKRKAEEAAQQGHRWLSMNAEPEEKRANFAATRWNEVFRATNRDAWAMSTWHVQRSLQPAVDEQDGPKAKDVSLTVRLHRDAHAKPNPFI